MELKLRMGLNIEDIISVEDVDGCYEWADPEDFRFLLQWIAEIWYVAYVDAHVYVDNVLVEVHVDFLHVDDNYDGHDCWVDAYIYSDSYQNG